MKQAAKATALVLAVSLLSGCSSAEAKACEAAQQARAEYKLETDNLYKTQIAQQNAQKFIEALSTSDQVKEMYLKSQKVIANNPTCFTPKELVEAQIYLGIK